MLHLSFSLEALHLERITSDSMFPKLTSQGWYCTIEGGTIFWCILEYKVLF